jgi:DNA-binding transcriptional LysR family regulator
MTFDQVESFLAVARFGSFRDAARQRGLSQPAVSRQVQALEKSLQARLVVRKRSGCQLTPEAREFLHYAETMVRLQLRARTFLQPRQVTVGASSNIGTCFLPRLIQRFEAAYPKFAVDVSIGTNEAIAQQLDSGAVDVALMEWWKEKPGYATAVWRREPLVVIVPPEHAWAARESIPGAWLFEEKLIGGERGTGTGTLLRQELGNAAAALRVTRQLGSTEAVKEAVRHRLGVSLVMAAAVRDETATGALRSLRIEGLELTKRLFSVVRKGAADQRVVAAFLVGLTDGVP